MYLYLCIYILIFSDVILKMAAWQPYYNCRFLDSGFRSVNEVCFESSISNFICMSMVVIGISLLIYSDVTFKIATRRPYWILWFPDSNFSLAVTINSKFQWHNTCVYGLEPIDFQRSQFQNGRLVVIFDFFILDSNFSLALNMNWKLHWPNTCVYE